MKKIVLSLLLASPLAMADDLLDVLDGKEKVDEIALVKKVSVFEGLVARPTAEQNIFFRFLESGDAKKALYQWPSAFDGTSFAKTSSGKALYGYLLFKNGLEVTGVETLFTANPHKINKKLVRYWQSLLEGNTKIWSYVDVAWAPQWTGIFGLPAQVSIEARRFDKDLTTAQLEKLLRKTEKKTWERNWVEWQYVVSLLISGQDAKAAKFLKHLQGVKENNTISQNLMNITAARMLYQNGYLNEAIGYYKKINKSSDYWFEAQEEMGWAYLRLGQPQNTLAHSMTLMNNDFSPEVGPESFYLTSLAHLKVCDYKEVSGTLTEFKTRFQKKAGSLMKIKDNKDMDAVKKVIATLQKGRVRMMELGSEGMRLPRQATRDEALFYLSNREMKLRKEAEKASQLYSQSLSEGTALVGFQAKMEKFKKFVNQRARNSFTAAVSRVQKLAAEEITEIHDVLKQMQIVEAELIQQLALSDRVMEDTKGMKSKTKAGTTTQATSETLSFPFNGEIWFDEISNYSVDVAKGCQSGKGETL